MTLTSRIPAIVAQAEAKAALIVEKTGTDIETGAKARAPVDTGNLRNSIQWTPHGPLAGEVTVGAEYGIFQEFGTRYQPAQPFLTPAVEDARPGFERAIATVYR